MLKSKYHHVHVEGRTPGPRGKAPMVTLENGELAKLDFEGSHHEAVYLAAIAVLVEAALAQETTVLVTLPFEHLIRQMQRDWDVGPKLQKVHDILTLVASLFENVAWDIAARSD